MNGKVIAYGKRRTPPYPFLVCLLCPSHVQNVRTIRRSESECTIASRLKEKDFRCFRNAELLRLQNHIVIWIDRYRHTHGATWETQTIPYTSFVFFDFLIPRWTSARNEHRKTHEIPRLRQGQKCLCWNVCLHVKINEKVIAYRKRRAPRYTFLECWFCPSHFQKVGTIRRNKSQYTIASRLKEKDV